MKRFLALLIVMVLVVSMMGVTEAFAASGKVSFSGPYKGEIQAGKTYTISYTFRVSGASAGNANISVGGVFEKVSGGDNLFHDTIPDNTSKSYKGKVRVRVKSNAQPGQKGTISASGRYSYLDSKYEEKSGKVTGSYSATVVTELTPRPVAEVKEVPPTEWELAHQGMMDMQQGAAVNLEIKESAKVPAAVLSLVQEKQGVLNIDFGSYSCTIDGKGFALPDGMSELDLTMNMEKDEQLSKAAEGVDAYQLHFAHSGQLPGPVTYRFKAEQNQPGDTLYLYYYYGEAGITEGKQTAVVDEDGYVTFTIYHCSSYFIAGAPILGAAGNLDAALVIAEKDLQISSLEAEISALNGQLQQALEDVQVQTVAAGSEGQGVEPLIPGAAEGLSLSLIEFIGMIAAALLLGVAGTLLISRTGKKGKHAAAAPDNI